MWGEGRLKMFSDGFFLFFVGFGFEKYPVKIEI